ncbi:RcnB family protein [Sphingopyxis indica]|uniref:RcnB family protein n=1 Tax=Sphingopyxis indica TaxID=436663 RepID=UPI002938D035|nr:RcnB family protein [Sphingopyxis indica]
MKKMFGGLLMAATILTPLGPAFARPDSPAHSAQRGDRGHRGSGASHQQRSPQRNEARSRPASRPHYQQRRVERPQAQRNVERRAVSRPQSTSAYRGRGERAGNDRRHGGYDRNRSQREQWNRNDRGRGDSRNWNRDDRGHNNDRDRYDRRNWNRNDRNHNDSRNWNRNDRRNDYRWDRNRNDYRYRGDRSRGWNRDWRHDRRYDWRSYRNVHRSYYRLPRYYSPYPHYGYRRFSIGFTLGSLFYGQRYWINDPWYYRLPPAYGNYRWVRYYDDALLVDIYSGRVVDVIYDFFW